MFEATERKLVPYYINNNYYYYDQKKKKNLFEINIYLHSGKKTEVKVVSY